MSGGAIGTMTASWTYYGAEDNSTILYGTEGIMRIYDDPVHTISVISKNGEKRDYDVEAIQTNDNQTKSGVIDLFIDCLKEDKQPPISGESVLSAMKAVFASIESSEDDIVGTGYKLYCLTSNCSFSCGNLVPAACKSSGKVTLVGQTTGGGSCIVLPCTTAAGAVFRISGSMQISIIQNGSFYNTDSGIVPHFFLDKPESYYDRPALAEYLRELK